ncbi:hypothetical protein I3842_05G114900 [Carya illinoinensis]|uniref:Uncharacterized protein n=1 Tax=Carya illinoinensis TaxID=32201 RepID=A0A922F1S2_CARIL|nr:hypothetical protein I3842_05G114900 [Carya illinoinensis]
MYVTRPLSMYIKSPEALLLPPPEGPSSGILVILDEEAEPTRCFSLCKTGYIKDLPLPQNKSLEHRYTTGIGFERYFHFQKEQEMPTCCFGGYVCDVTPRPLDPTNLNQQFMICRKGGIVNNWVCAEASPEFEFGEAQRLDTTLHARLLEFNFSLTNTTSNPVVLGKWYCPFIFIKEGTPKSLKDKMSNLIYYEITLQQKWEQIFASENNDSQTQGNSVAVDALVKIEVVRVAGWEAVIDERNVANGVLWFRSCSNLGEEASVALGLAVIERMKWKQERVGWIGETYGKQMRIERLEGFGGTGGWKRFGCYVLVESFVLKRLDGTLLLTYDFKHTQIRSKWE